MELIIDLLTFLGIDYKEIEQSPYSPFTQEELLESKNLHQQEYDETIQYLDNLFK